MQHRKTIQKINEINSWFLEKISKTDKLLARLKGQGGYTVAKLIRIKQCITVDTRDIKKIIKECYEQHKFDNLDEIDQFHKVPPLSQYEIHNLNSL